MSISRLRQVAGARLPLNVSDREAIPELHVLMSEGLIAALRVRLEAEPGGGCMPMVRVLAITPDGWRLLRRAEGGDAGQEPDTTRH